MNWDYEQPVTIRFGSGRLVELPACIDELGCSRALLVSSAGFEKRGTLMELAMESGGRVAASYARVTPNAPFDEAQLCVDLIKENDCDCVVALGGGSVMDTAKAAACICKADKPVEHFLEHADELPSEGLPVIAIPTTAGTASEVTRVSVLSDPVTHAKHSLHSDALYAKIALVDPELTYTVPRHTTASSGIDVLCHALEGYWCKNHQPITDAMATSSLERAFRHLGTACEDPENEEAREGMCEASVFAGLAFSLPGTTAPHACSYPLTELFGIPHGEACGLTLVHFLRLNAASDPEGRILRLAHKLGFANIEEMAGRIVELQTRTGLLRDLKSFSPTDKQVEALVAGSKNSTLLRNPVEVTDEDLYRIFNELC